MTQVHAQQGARLRERLVGRGRRAAAAFVRQPLALAGVACVVLAALSLLVPASVSADPWVWLVWGQEISDGHLYITGGSSWKPLPVLLTAPYVVLFGDAAPELWLVTVRAAAFMSCVLAARIAWRIAGPIAAVIAAFGQLLLASWFRYATSGTSELIAIALLLGAIEAHIARRRALALVLMAMAGLGRPEVLPFMAVYAAWLLWQRERRLHLALVAGIFAAVPALWFGPQLRAGNASQASDLAQASGLGDRTSVILERAVTMVAWPIELFAVVALVWAIVRRERRVLWLGALVAGWIVLVVVMNLMGYAGLRRFFLPAASVVTILAGIGLAWTARRIGKTPALAALVAVLVVAVAAPFSTPDPSWHSQFAVAEQRNELTEDLKDAVERTGSRQEILACGKPVAVNASVGGALSWYLRVPLVDTDNRVSKQGGLVFATGRSRASPGGPPYASDGTRVISLFREGLWTVYVGIPPGLQMPPGCAPLVRRHDGQLLENPPLQPG